MKIRHFLRFPVDFAKAKRKLGNRCDVTTTYAGRAIVLDLYTTDLLLDCGRHFASLAHYAAQVDSPVLVRCNRILLAAIAHKPFGSQMLEMPNVNWIDPRDAVPENCILLTDIADRATQRDQTGGHFVVMLIGKDIIDDGPVMPYPMHPGVLEYAEQDRLQACRRVTNRRGIFFSGSQRAKYGRDIIREGFDVLNRLEILQYVRDSFADRVVVSLDETDRPMPIVLPAPEGMKASAPIPIDQWLPSLAQHQFFLCCPGIAQPMCHNIIEAMSVGVIPIVEYPERFSPQLIDGVNAICYRDRAGLASAIQRIDRMSAAEIHQFSERVSSHFDQHLDGNRFVRELIEKQDDDAPSSICMPFHDENLTAMREYLGQRSKAA